MRITLILGLIAMLAINSVCESAFFWLVWGVAMILDFISITKGE